MNPTSPSLHQVFSLCAAATLALFVSACSSSGRTGGSDSELYREIDPGTWATYAAHCALCHGESGRGDGPASTLLFPPARDFTHGRFKLASTNNGIPTDQDLIATLRRGMPGSAMPSWSWMTNEELRGLARVVRELAVEGIAQRMASGSTALEQNSEERARGEMTPAEPIEVVSPAPDTDVVLARGKRLYSMHCADCHGVDGKGHQQIPRPDHDGTLNWARDFTAGILKGGASHEDLYRRLWGGVHGTSMPFASLLPDELAELIAYVRHLIPEDAELRLVQRRERFQAVRVDPGVGLDPESSAWETAAVTRIALAPLWWHGEAVTEARISALHDGHALAVRVRWDDSTVDTPPLLEPPHNVPPYADAIALQLSSDLHPPFFGMAPRLEEGAAPTNLWHWRATDLPGLPVLSALQRRFPHRIGDWWAVEVLKGIPLYQLASGPLQISGEAVSTTPSGMSSLHEQEARAGSVSAVASWYTGAWDVTLSRPLEPSSPRELSLRPGDGVSVSFAIWNGSTRDLRGQKSITIWHELVLAP